MGYHQLIDPSFKQIGLRESDEDLANAQNTSNSVSGVLRPEPRLKGKPVLHLNPSDTLINTPAQTQHKTVGLTNQTQPYGKILECL